MKDRVVISASIACADFGCLKQTFEKLEESGVELLHFDVVDGHFAPTFIMGPPVLASLRKYTSLPFEAHLACYHPERFLSQFRDAGTDYFAFHFEAVENPSHFVSLVREKGMKPVIALRPETPQEELSDDLLSLVDMILILTVKPGFAGQEFDERVLPKIGLLAKRLKTINPECLIEVDGNINETTIPEVVKQGARVLVGGTSGLFRKDRSIEESVRIMRNSALRILERGSCL